MNAATIVLELETRLVNAWPSFEVELADGWLLRFAEGYSKRANAATPILPGAALDPALVRHIAAAFDARGLPPCFRLTGLQDPAAEAVLADEGLLDFDPSDALVATLRDDLERDASVLIQPVAKPRWVTAAASAYGGEKSDSGRLGRILGMIHQPAAFATLRLDGEDAAWGFAVAERGFAGLYDIVVAPNLRGLGLGRRLVTSLMSWGRDEGATQAYLQMRRANTVAALLYRSLGFELAYGYTHRVPAGGR